MIEALIGLVFALIVFGILWYIITLLPLPAPFPLIIQLLMVLILLVVLWHFFAPLLLGGPSLTYHGGYR